MNAVAFAGNLVDAPELRYTQSGAPVANFTVAVNRSAKDGEGTWSDHLEGFFRCVAWRRLAENAAESLNKGDRVVIAGRLQQRSWEDDGTKHSIVEVLVDDLGPSLRFAGAREEMANSGAGIKQPAESESE